MKEPKAWCHSSAVVVPWRVGSLGSRGSGVLAWLWVPEVSAVPAWEKAHDFPTWNGDIW